MPDEKFTPDELIAESSLAWRLFASMINSIIDRTGVSKQEALEASRIVWKMYKDEEIQATTCLQLEDQIVKYIRAMK